MKRRQALLGAFALPVALGAWAQKAVYRVGIVLSTSPLAEMLGPDPIHPRIRTVVHALRAFGYVEGRNLVLERRSAEGRFERFEEIFAELLALKPDALIVVSVGMAQAARKLTRTVPIVMVLSDRIDPVAAGLVASLARPGGNVTGVLPDAGPEISGKRVQLLKEAVPAIRKIAFLGLEAEWKSAHGENARSAARALGMSMFHAESSPNDYAAAFEAIVRERADAVFVGGHPVHYASRQAIVDFAARARLPSVHAFTEAAQAGGLMSYTSISDEVWRRAVEYVDRILKGANPGELPIEQPAKFMFTLNLASAKALGLRIPQPVLLSADRVIE